MSTNPIKVMIDGRGAFKKEIVDQFAKIAGAEAEVVLHFGDKDADFHAACLTRMEVRDGKRGHLFDTPKQGRGRNVALMADPKFQDGLERAVDQLHRLSSTYQYRSHNLNNLQDYIDYYHILADAYAQQIIESGATHAVFMMVPHLGYDTILFQVARALGLKTIVMVQITLFDDRYFTMADPDDFGSFDPEETDHPAWEVEKNTVPDLFFMEKEWQSESPRGSISAKAVLNFFKFVALKSPGKLLNPAYLVSRLRRIQNIYRAFPKWRDPFANFFHENELAFFEHLAEFERTPADLSRKFVYVPLHNQPEMSTSTLGGDFRDQVLAIEAMSALIPDDWVIYVKENPRQNAFARGPLYFHRLNRLGNVQIVPSDANTYDLANHCQIAATVTGTVGWESLRHGRPVIVFGNAWYKAMPGAIPYRPDLDVEAIAKTEFAHDALTKAAGQVKGRCHPGVVDPIFVPRLPDFDRAANAQTIADQMLGLIKGEIPLTFPGDKDPA